MAATPYKGTMLFRGLVPTKNGLQPSGRTYAVPFTADDVAGARVDFDQTGTEDYTPPEIVQLVDITTSADGVDTKRLELYVDGMQTSHTWRIGALKDTIQQPHILAPPMIGARAKVQFYQRA